MSNSSVGVSLLIESGDVRLQIFLPSGEEMSLSELELLLPLIFRFAAVTTSHINVSYNSTNLQERMTTCLHSIMVAPIPLSFM